MGEGRLGSLRTLVGRAVQVACADGQLLTGTLLSCNGRSLWLLAGDEDRFVALADVAELAPAS